VGAAGAARARPHHHSRLLAWWWPLPGPAPCSTGRLGTAVAVCCAHVLLDLGTLLRRPWGAPTAAIRVAIGMARPRDVVVVVGKGHRDWQEYWDGAEFGPEQRETVKVGWGGRGEAGGVCLWLAWIGWKRWCDPCFVQVLLREPDNGPPQSWFDDRVECRNALSKLPYLAGIKVGAAHGSDSLHSLLAVARPAAASLFCCAEVAVPHPCGLYPCCPVHRTSALMCCRGRGTQRSGMCWRWRG
jgi:hypothetical protein